MADVPRGEGGRRGGSGLESTTGVDLRRYLLLLRDQRGERVHVGGRSCIVGSERGEPRSHSPGACGGTRGTCSRAALPLIGAATPRATRPEGIAEPGPESVESGRPLAEPYH